MAQDDQGNYYYDAGTVNEQLDDYEVYERGGRLFLNNEAASEAAAFLGQALQLGAERGPPANSDFDNVDQRVLYLSDGTSGAVGDLMVARADGGGGVEAAVIASPGAYSAV